MTIFHGTLFTVGQYVMENMGCEMLQNHVNFGRHCMRERTFEAQPTTMTEGGHLWATASDRGARSNTPRLRIRARGPDGLLKRARMNEPSRARQIQRLL